MAREELAKEYIRRNWGVAENLKGAQFLRFGLNEINADITYAIPEFAHLNWGEQTILKIAENEKDARPEMVLEIVEKVVNEFMLKWWPILVEREIQDPWTPPKKDIYKSYQHALEDENQSLSAALERALEKIQKLERGKR